MRSDQRTSNQLRDTTLTPNFLMHAEGSVLIEAGTHEVICAASVEDRVPSFLTQHRQGLGDRRVRHAAARHEHADAARGVAGQSRRPHAGDSAADRPVPAVGDQPARARRANHLDRLRRHPGRRRHADGVDHRRVRRAGAGARDACASAMSSGRSRSPTTSPRPASGSSTASRCSIWPTTTTAAPTWT